MDRLCFLSKKRIMFKIKTLFHVTFLIICTTNCASYMKSRAYDAMDILTLGVDKNLYGASIWLSCFGFGLQHGERSVGYGIRNGHIGKYRSGQSKKTPFFLNYGNSILLFNSMKNYPITKGILERHKSSEFTALSMLIIPASCRRGTTCKNYDYCSMPLAFEFSMGLHYGFRFGFNFKEFADFLLGIIGIDFMEDDVK